jgi:DNA-binding CsgD family transcriptional regulator
MKTITFIYGLIDPDNNMLRYIGQTKNPVKRYNEHLYKSEIERKNTYKHNWIKYLIKDNKKPIYLELDQVPNEESDYWERFYIAYFKSIGCDLVNGTQGGKIFKLTRNSIDKISIGLMGKKYIKHTDNHKNKKHNINIDELKELFLVKNLSKKDIATIFNVSERVIKYELFINKITKYKIKSHYKYNPIPSGNFKITDIRYLKSLGLTDKQIGDKVGCHRNTVNKYLNNKLNNKK